MFKSLIAKMEDAERTISILDDVKWITLSVKQIRAETVTKCFIKTGIGDNIDTLDEANENRAKTILIEQKTETILKTIFIAMTISQLTTILKEQQKFWGSIILIRTKMRVRKRKE